MRLGVDLRCVTEGEPGGIATYARELLPRLTQEFKSWEILGLITGLKPRKPDFPFSVKSFHQPNKFINFSLISFNSPKLDKYLGQADIFFAPTPKYIALSPKAKLVLTIHDLSFIEHPEYFTFRQRLWHKFLKIKKLLKRADRIIAVSEHTAFDIGKFAPEVKSKIRVIYSGVDHVPQAKLERLKDLPEKYLLAFSPPEPRKNIGNLLKAYALIYPKVNLPLVLIGSGKFTEQNGIIKKPFLSDSERWQVLANAQALIYPSIYEGFGFPPLEAFKLGVPVLASQVTSLPEVLGEAAILFDPWDPKDIARAIEVLVNDENLQERLRQLGYNQAKKYQWALTAQKTAGVIKELT
ncbi:MAG: glycosyltransferase family 1 protein [Patescibacteria group bacterium]|jgi:glycosyltransferase involved in cell wall biosynthesis